MQSRTITQDEFALLKQYRQLSHAEKIIVKRFLSGLLFDAQKKKSPSGQGWTKNATNRIEKERQHLRPLAKHYYYIIQGLPLQRGRPFLLTLSSTHKTVSRPQTEMRTVIR